MVAGGAEVTAGGTAPSLQRGFPVTGRGAAPVRGLRRARPLAPGLAAAPAAAPCGPDTTCRGVRCRLSLREICPVYKKKK